MVEKITDLSKDRILTVLNRMELPCRISPEKIIIYGFFFLGIVAFVNWFLSFTIIIIKPVLYAVLMLVAVRPELMKFITNDSTVIKIIETLKCFFGAIAGGILDLVQGWHISIVKYRQLLLFIKISTHMNMKVGLQLQTNYNTK